MQLFSHTRNRAEVIRNEMTEAYAESIILNNAYSDKICGTNHSLVLHSCNNVLRELITTCLPFISIISIGFSSILIGSNIQSDVIGKIISITRNIRINYVINIYIITYLY
jgi:hypothetical protein